MPLIGLFVGVTPEELERFSHAHAADHDEIDDALRRAGLTATPSVILDPFPPLDGMAAWLLRHQQKHTDVNTALNIAGDDLSQFNFSKKDDIALFIGANFSEHNDWHSALND